MGNSGTSMRLLSGILSAQNLIQWWRAIRVYPNVPWNGRQKPLRDMGAKIQTTGEKGTPPISITGNQTLTGIRYEMPMASAQVKSCLLIAGLWAQGTTTVIEPEVTRDHTERMLTAFGLSCNSVKKSTNGNQTVTGRRINGMWYRSACWYLIRGIFMVAGAIAQQGNVTIKSGHQSRAPAWLISKADGRWFDIDQWNHCWR